MEEIIIDGLDQVEVDNTAIEDIESENVNLMFLGIDRSGSMGIYLNDMAQSLVDFKQALKDSKEANDILVARADFDSNVQIGGYKTIEEFDTQFNACGCTAMYDCITQGVKKLIEYRKFLKDEGVRVKAVFAIFGDGIDNNSISSFSEAKKAIAELNKEEITTAFISFGGEADNVAKDLGFMNILKVGSSASELRKAFGTLSKSVIESSKSVVADNDNFFI